MLSTIPAEPHRMGPLVGVKKRGIGSRPTPLALLLLNENFKDTTPERQHSSVGAVGLAMYVYTYVCICMPTASGPFQRHLRKHTKHTIHTPQKRTGGQAMLFCVQRHLPKHTLYTYPLDRSDSTGKQPPNASRQEVPFFCNQTFQTWLRLPLSDDGKCIA